MIDIPTNVKQGIDINRQGIPDVVRGGISADLPIGQRTTAPDRQQAPGRPPGNQPSRPAVSSPGRPPVSPPNRAAGNQSSRPAGNQPKPPGSTIPRHQGVGAVLSKGQKTSLTALSPGLRMVDVCLGWDVLGKSQYDLDTECFMLGADGKVVGDEWFVFYNQPVSPDGAVRHCGDSKTGDGNGDDEIIQVNLAQINQQVNRLVFILTINEAKELRLNFSGVSNAFIRVVDKGSNRELVRFPITEYYNTITSMVVGELYRYKGEWKFTPIGEGTQDDLSGLCIRYGVDIEE